jgi:hypothetical protein
MHHAIARLFVAAARRFRIGEYVSRKVRCAALPARLALKRRGPLSIAISDASHIEAQFAIEVSMSESAFSSMPQMAEAFEADDVLPVSIIEFLPRNYR